MYRLRFVRCLQVIDGVVTNGNGLLKSSNGRRSGSQLYVQAGDTTSVLLRDLGVQALRCTVHHVNLLLLRVRIRNGSVAFSTNVRKALISESS